MIAKSGRFAGKLFFGCNHFPECKYLISLHFDESAMTDNQHRLADAFRLFVCDSFFIQAAFGVVYFNLRNAAFLDYLLKTDIVYDAENVEIGKTGAKIFNELFYYLYLIPENEVRRYLVNNFPITFAQLPTNKYLIGVGDIDFNNINFDESIIEQYKDISTFNI